MYQEMKAEALNHIIPFWLGMKDNDYGGYYGEMDNQLVINKKGYKGGIASARLLWSFSAAYNVLGQEEVLDHAEHAYQFLVDKVLDSLYGGLVWMLDYKGQIIDWRKHVYAQSFGIYALSEYYIASGRQDALDKAYDLFELIESKGFRHDKGIYGEEYTREWTEADNEMLSENGVTASITTNTLLHIMEAYTRFYQVTLDKKIRERLLFVTDLFIKKIWNKKTNHMKVFFDSDWKELLDLKSYGHDIEATWLLDRALDVLGLDDNETYTSFVEDIGYQILDEAVAEDGSIYNESENNTIDQTRVWWCQAEAIVGFVNLYERTHNQKFLQAAKKMWTYTKEKLIDSRPGGEWFYSLDETGLISPGYIVEPWKTPYHNLRACLEVVKRFDIKEKNDDSSKILRTEK